MKKLLLIAILSLLTACGGEESFTDAVIDNTPGLTAEEKSVLKIANFVKHNEGEVPPLSIFISAGLINVDETNKKSIIKLLTQFDFEDIDSKEKIQDIIDKYNVAIDKVEAYAEGGSDLPTVEDYLDIGIIDITSAELDQLNVKISELSSIENLNLFQIQELFESI